MPTHARKSLPVTPFLVSIFGFSYTLILLRLTSRGLVVERSLDWVGVHALVTLHEKLNYHWEKSSEWEAQRGWRHPRTVRPSHVW